MSLSLVRHPGKPSSGRPTGADRISGENSDCHRVPDSTRRCLPKDRIRTSRSTVATDPKCDRRTWGDGGRRGERFEDADAGSAKASAARTTGSTSASRCSGGPGASSSSLARLAAAAKARRSPETSVAALPAIPTISG
jgi:hypothetical protein